MNPRIPASTYRFQFHAGFRFEDARRLLPYLDKLGITDLYASPLLQACAGSTHGYNVADPRRLNPELGTEADFDSLARALKKRKMGLLLDIVPNHMAASPENPWWWDVLEKGPHSRYAPYFDIAWSAQGTGSPKLKLPLLGEAFEQALSEGKFRLAWEGEGLTLRYGSQRFPLACHSYAAILNFCPSELMKALKNEPKLEWTYLRSVQAASMGRSEVLKGNLKVLQRESKAFQALLLENARRLSEDPGFRTQLSEILGQQHYELHYWKEGLRKINYRRFFDVSDLVGLRAEHPAAFHLSHALVRKWMLEGKVTGLRVDHIDGLKRPLDYLRRLQRHASPRNRGKAQSAFIVVEKILGPSERLREDWPVAGTTGYEFIHDLNRFFLHPEGLPKLHSLFRQSTQEILPFPELAFQKKNQVARSLFSSEFASLARQVRASLAAEHPLSGLSCAELETALMEFTACLPVYRTYIDREPPSEGDSFILRQALEAFERRHSLPASFSPRDWASLFLPLGKSRGKPWLDWILRWQQLSGAVMAKGVEDTAFYNYPCLLSCDEVGGDPDASALSMGEFHRLQAERLARQPFGLSPSSTHDTKRSEDMRARLNVLTELPELWAEHLQRWKSLNLPLQERRGEAFIPDEKEELLIYQTLVGAWPFQARELPAFRRRLGEYLVKALREAKVHSHWLEPQPEYEARCIRFAQALCDPNHEGFLADFLPFQRKLAFYGALNSLTQLLLKASLPGIPDFFQGSELWDLSLVDPDNRRPVNFPKRARLLKGLRRGAAFCQGLLRHWKNGEVKLHLAHSLLAHRRKSPDLFLKGDYLPLSISGDQGEAIAAFFRRWKREWLLVVAPRFWTRHAHDFRFPLGLKAWGNASLPLPKSSPRLWKNLLTGERLRLPRGQEHVPLASLLQDFPLGFLAGQT